MTATARRRDHYAAMNHWPETFALVRHHDISGISGTGTVAYGTRFSDGTTVIRWCGDTASTVIWDSLDHAMQVHGHDGATEIQWLVWNITADEEDAP